MFDPSKLDIDFSDTSDLNKMEKSKKTVKTVKKTTETKTEIKPVETNDVLSGISVDDIRKDTINLENNKKVEVVKKVSDSSEIDMRINPKQDAKTLATIITDAELIEKDSMVKDFNKQKEEKKQSDPNQKKTIDINLTKLNDFISILLREKYDYFRLEPSDDEVKVTFVKDSVEREIKYIKYPTYSRVLVEIKKATNLKFDQTEGEQR